MASYVYYFANVNLATHHVNNLSIFRNTFYSIPDIYAYVWIACQWCNWIARVSVDGVKVAPCDSDLKTSSA